MTTFEKSIQYERETRDYRAELDGQLIGFFGSYHAAEVELNRVVYERLIDGDCATAAEMDAPIDPPDEPNPLGDEEGASTPPDRPRACYTLTDILIAQAIDRNRLCPNCEGAHWGWQCPEIAARPFRPAEPEPWKDIALGRELCRMKWRNFRAFVALLLSVPAERLVIYAASYQAFIREYRPDSDLTINDVLRAWARDMQRDPTTPRLGGLT